MHFVYLDLVLVLHFKIEDVLVKNMLLVVLSKTAWSKCLKFCRHSWLFFVLFYEVNAGHDTKVGYIYDCILI